MSSSPGGTGHAVPRPAPPGRSGPKRRVSVRGRRSRSLGEYPGLRDGQWIDDPVAGWEGLALIWDCADSADLFLPVISELTFGCAPSHRWAFELDDAPSTPADPGMRPAELELLLRV